VENEVSLTNRYGLPEAIVKAVVNDKYSRAGSHISVTGLLQPPQIRALLETNEPEEDVAERIWSLLGQATHTILERAYENEPDVLVEQRLFMGCLGWEISGQYDVLDLKTKTLYDYKVTTVWNRDGKDDWTRQMNLLRLLAHHNGQFVDKLVIIPIFRDWQKSKVGTGGEDNAYPEAQVRPIEIPVWGLDEAQKYMEERVRLHQTRPAVPCTDEDRWMKPATFAVMKKGQVRAKKLCDTIEEATKVVQELGEKDHSILTRPASPTRCLNYCGVSRFCPQMQAEADKLLF
jgi:hypothetical protein